MQHVLHSPMSTLSGQIKFLGKFLTKPGIWVLCQGKDNRNAFFVQQMYFVRNGISVWNAGIRLSGVACLLHGLKWLVNHFSLLLENKPVLLLYFLLWSLYELLINCAIPWHCFFVNPSVTWWLASFHLVQCLLSSSLFYL